MSETTNNELGEVEALLATEVERERAENKKSLIFGLVAVVIVGCYLGWAYARIASVLEPQAVAEIASGAVVTGIPAASAHLRTMVVDGAPALAESASTTLVELIPGYRAQLELKAEPLVDESAELIAEVWMQKVLEHAKDQRNKPEKLAMADAAEAFGKHVAGVLDEAMDTPMQNGRKPREVINASLEKLERLDKGLKQIAKKGHTSKERDLLVGWLSLLSEYQ